MASKAAKSKNDRRKELTALHRERRAELKSIIKDVRLPSEERQLAVRTLNKMPRDGSRSRIRNRCVLTGRPRAYYRKFGLSRIALRDLGLRGDLPGLVKSSW
jgi:small subunit ribosomal protein S14